MLNNLLVVIIPFKKLDSKYIKSTEIYPGNSRTFYVLKQFYTQYVDIFLLKTRREFTGLYLVDTCRILERLIHGECKRRTDGLILLSFCSSFHRCAASGNLSPVRDYNEIEISGCRLSVYIHSMYIYI